MSITQYTIIDSETITEELLRFSNIESMLELLKLPQNKYTDVGNIMSQIKIDWDNAPCNPGGATKEQDAHMDGLLSFATEQLLAIK